MSEHLVSNPVDEPITPSNFIQDFIQEDLAEGGRFAGKTLHTRFPPEPNGYLHIGHAKAICIDFGNAEKFGGICNLRMDDTNPAKEDVEYVEAIQEDIRWLGFDWEDRFYYASEYFEKMYQLAQGLIRKGLAYVCDLTPEEMRQMRGNLTEPGTESPYRNRSVEENLELFAQMRAGAFPDGSRTLRAKIDMTSGNINMRDPVIYRIARLPHHRTGTQWCIYPMYDFAHPLEDAIEHITHSLCSLEFEDHRPLYDWFIEHCDVPSRPRQIEFSRLGLTHTVMSKRKLRTLVETGRVSGWDDPRMPTLCGLRRRGFTPRSIRNFCERIGVSKVASTVEYAFLEHCLREDLNATADRAMVVLHPVLLEITNYPEGKTETFTAENNPEDPQSGTHEVVFSKHLWVDAEDFMEEPPKKYFRLYPGNEVRLKHAYIIRCTGCEKDENGTITKILATYDPDSRGGNAADGRKIKGTIHWVDRGTACPVEVRLYNALFTDPNPEASEQPFTDLLAEDSLEVLPEAQAEAWLREAQPGTHYQFLRTGYFTVDTQDSHPGQPIFNRSVSLKDGFKPGAKPALPNT